MNWIKQLKRYNRFKRIKAIRKVVRNAMVNENPSKLKFMLVHYFEAEDLIITETISYNYITFETKGGMYVNICEFHLVVGLREAIKVAYLDKIRLEF